MIISDLLEFYCIVDILLDTLKSGDTMKVDITYSGVIKRNIKGEVSIARVKDSPARVIARYDSSGYFVKSTTSPEVARWLKFGSNVDKCLSVSTYLAFIKNIENIRVNSIEINDLDILKEISNDTFLSIYKLFQYVSSKDNSVSIKAYLTNGKKKVPLIFDNGIFYRYVKTKSTYTLYINDEDKFNNIFKGYHLCGFMLGSGLPDITSQIDLLKYIAEVNNCQYSYV